MSGASTSTDEDVTAWEYECGAPGCDFRFELPMRADDRNGDYALNIAMTHEIEAHPE